VIARLLPAGGAILILAVAMLRVAAAPRPSLHAAAWIALAALAIGSVLVRADRRANTLAVGAFAVAAIVIVRFGRYECWSVFASLCGGAPPQAGWTTAFVGQDTFTYLEAFTENSIRPPLYGWFARAATAFMVTTAELIEQTRNLVAYETNQLGAIAYLADHPQRALQRIAQAQQLALWAAAAFFAWSAARVVPVLAVAAVMLAFYDGGVLTHGYFAHAIEAKMLYLAGMFFAAGAALRLVVAPTWGNLALLAVACAALPLIRPQGLMAALLLAFGCLRFLAAQPRRSGRAAGVAAAALALFAAAALLPTIVTYVGHRVLQPSNIYAMSRIAFALQVATPDDVAALPDALTRDYLTNMLTLRDEGGGKPPVMAHSVHRNMGIAITACIKIGGEEMLRLVCGNTMGTVASVVLSRHYGEYLGTIVLPAIAVLGSVHLGGAVGSVPLSLLLGSALVVILAFTAPWLAAWGAAILALHVSLLVLLSTLAGPDSVYLITSEPVLIAALTVLLVRALRDGVARLRSRRPQSVVLRVPV
jgi:hypothetical protein